MEIPPSSIPALRAAARLATLRWALGGSRGGASARKRGLSVQDGAGVKAKAQSMSWLLEVSIYQTLLVL